MIDIQLLRTNLDAVADRLAARGYEFPREEFLALEAERRNIQTRTQELQAARNAQAKKIGQAKARGEDVAALMAESGAINAQLGDLEKTLALTQERMRQLLEVIPNLPHESVPVGHDSNDNPVVREWGEKPQFSFTPREHWDIGESLGILDILAPLGEEAGHVHVVGGGADEDLRVTHPAKALIPLRAISSLSSY